MCIFFWFVTELGMKESKIIYANFKVSGIGTALNVRGRDR